MDKDNETGVFTKEEIAEKLEKYDSWVFDEESGKVLSGFELEDYDDCISFASDVAEIAEEIEHHPDILIHDYKFVTIFTYTNDAKGITQRDFDLIEKIESELDGMTEEE